MSVVDERAGNGQDAGTFVTQPGDSSHTIVHNARSASRRWWIAVGVLYLVAVLAFLVGDWLPRFGAPYILPYGPALHYFSLVFVGVFGVVAIVACAISAGTVGRRVGGIAVSTAALLFSAYAVWAVSREYYLPTVYLLPLVTADLPVGAVISFIWMVLLFLGWALTRPIRGLGYISIALIAVTGVVWSQASAFYAGPVIDSILVLVVLIVLPGAVVAVALLGTRAAKRRAPKARVATVPVPTDQAGRTNTMAILSLVFAFVFSILGVVFGHVALSQISRTGESGRGLAVAGLAVGYTAVALGIVVIVWQLVILQSVMSGLGM